MLSFPPLLNRMLLDERPLPRARTSLARAGLRGTMRDMCGRFGIEKMDELDRRFRIKPRGQSARPYLIDPGELTARYNAAPGQDLPVVIREADENLLARMRWRLVPSWAREERVGYRMINARAETVDKRSAYRKPLAATRCLVPASFFYEWKASSGGKVPHVIQRKDKRLFAMAGLYDVWERKGGEPLYTFTILTRPPNDVVSPIHDRMPVLLRESDEDMWLAPGTDPVAYLRNAPAYPSQELEAYPVSRRVNDARHDRPELIRRVK